MHPYQNEIRPTRFIAILLTGLLALPGGTNPGQAAEGIEKPPAWEKTAALGVTLTSGNSDTLLATANIRAQKKWDKNELSLGADASYGENDSIKNNESVRGFAQYNRMFTDRFFGYLRAEALHDAIADVEYRITLSPGVGYYFIKNEKTLLSGEVGPGVVLEKQGGTSHEYFTIRFAERFEHKINDRAQIWQSLEFLPQVDDWDNFILNAEIGVSSSITKSLSLRAYIQDTYDNEPAPGRKENDLKLVAGVEYKF